MSYTDFIFLCIKTKDLPFTVFFRFFLDFIFKECYYIIVCISNMQTELDNEFMSVSDSDIIINKQEEYSDGKKNENHGW